MADWTTDDLDTLNKAIAQGVTEVRYGDKTVIYRSLAEMLRLRDMMKKELGLSTKSASVYPEITKGLE